MPRRDGGRDIARIIPDKRSATYRWGTVEGYFGYFFKKKSSRGRCVWIDSVLADA